MSSKRAIRRRSCSNKERYNSKTEANRAAFFSRRRTGEWIIAYKCRFQPHWHIGHPTREMKQGLRAKRDRMK